MRPASLLAVVLLVACSAPATPPAPPADGGRAVVEAAMAAIESGDPATAIAPLQGLLRASPEDAHARGVLAHALLATNQLGESRTEGRLALAFDPTLPSVAWNIACSYAREGDADQAIPWLQRALATSGVEPREVAEDPDLSTLEGDHRLAVYYATGVLSRAEEDAVAVVDRDRVRAGDPVRLSVALMQLNKPLLSPADAVLAATPASAPDLAVLERIETFTRGSEGDREYSQRTVHFTLVPLRPGVVQLGPFAVQSEDARSVTTPVFLRVEGDPSPAPAGAADAAWLAFPSQVDDEAVALLTASGVEPIPLSEDVAPTLPEFLAQPDGTRVRLLRFRARVVELPAWVPARPARARRSALLRKSTEGWSWVLDVIPPG